MLARAFEKKLGERFGGMLLESLIAEGLLAPEVVSPSPPKWVLNAAKVTVRNFVEPLRAPDGSISNGPAQLGAMRGMVMAFRAAMENPSANLRQLEEKQPLLAELRASMAKLAEPQVRAAEALGSKVTEEPKSAHDVVQSTEGEVAGARRIVDSDGELREDFLVRVRVCFLLWLYWPELHALESISELHAFLQDFGQDDVSRKNLEKVCAGIGLRFKGRGRPKNPTARGRRVGIQKSTTGVKRRDGNSRRRKTNPD